jgi:hypothetical protein
VKIQISTAFRHYRSGLSKTPRQRGSLTNLFYGVTVGLTVIVGVAPPKVAVAIGLPIVDVEVALVGVLTGGARVGVREVTGVNVGVHVGVMGSGGGGGQVCSLTVNWWQSLP